MLNPVFWARDTGVDKPIETVYFLYNVSAKARPSSAPTATGWGPGRRCRHGRCRRERSHPLRGGIARGDVTVSRDGVTLRLTVASTAGSSDGGGLNIFSWYDDGTVWSAAQTEALQTMSAIGAL